MVITLDNRSIKLTSRNVADYELSAKPIKLRRKKYKKDINRQRRILEKREIEKQTHNIYHEINNLYSSYEWEMCDEISLANSVMIDNYDYWNHPSFIKEEVDS